jgi:hypothetical protein
MVEKDPPGRYFAAAPTRDQAKRIWWEDLKSMLQPGWKTRVSDSELWIRTIKGAELWVVGLDVAARVEGTPWDGCVIDELANCKPKIWQANIRPALADRKGWAWLIGVPDMQAPGQVDYEAMVDRAMSGVDPEWACFTWPSESILPKSEVESARLAMDPRIFEQEYLGKFILTGGRAFGDFNMGLHVRPTPYDPALPICWSLDFNIDPMCAGVIQHYKGQIAVIDELTLPDTKTETACVAFMERAEANHWDLRGLTIYGDASGGARDSTSGISDWHIVKNCLRRFEPRVKVPRANPGIKDTINAVNAKLKNVEGDASLRIDPRCHRLIDDLKSALWPGDLGEQHAIAWLRYFVEYEYPVLPEKTGVKGRVGFSQ